MTRRILCMEVSPDVPQGLTYGTLAPGTVKPATWLTMGANNLSVTRNGTGAGFAGILGSMPISAGKYYWETKPLGTTTLNYAYCGLVNSLVTAYESANGADLRSMMMHSGNGRLIFNSAIGLDVGQVLPTDIIRWWVDLDARELRIAKNGGAFAVAAAKWETAGVWYPCINAQQNTYGWAIRPGGGAGSSTFTYSIPDAQTIAYAAQAAAIPTTLRLASRAFTGPEYMSGVVPPMPLTYYDGRMSVRSDITMSRSIGVWMQGSNSGSAPGIGYVDFINQDGALSVWKNWIWRNKVATLCYVDGDLPTVVSDGKIWTSAIVDRVQDMGDIMRVHFVDFLAQLQKPVSPISVRRQADTGISSGRDIVTVGTEVEGDPTPFVLGVVYQMQPYNINPAPGVREYQFSSDVPLSSIAVYDRCDLYDELVTGFDFRRTQMSDGFRMEPTIAGPDGKVTGDIIGPWYRGTQRVTLANGGAFTAWAGDNPTGWTMTTVETAACRFTQSGTACRIQQDGTSQQTMRHDASAAAWTVGNGIEIQLSVTAITTAGPIYAVITSGLTTAVRRVQVTAVGLYRISCAIPAGATAYSLHLSSGRNGGAGDIVDVTIDDLEAWEYTPITKIQDFVKYLVVDKGGMLVGDINTASTAALAAKFNPTLGFSSPDSVNCDVVLRQAMDSFGGFVYVSRLNKICVGRLEDVDGQAPVLSINHGDITGQLIVEVDQAKSLTTILGGLRNWSPTDTSSMAGSVSIANRKKWSARNQVVRQALGVVDPFYAFADQAKARDTLLQVSGDVRDEVARIATLYAKKRHFYRFTVPLDLETANELNPGDTVRLTYPLHELDQGRELMLVSITQRFFSQAVDLVLWG